MSDRYRTVTATIKQIRANAIMVEVKGRQGWASIPRSLLHSADDFRMDVLALGPDGIEQTFRVMEWKAEQVGLA